MFSLIEFLKIMKGIAWVVSTVSLYREMVIEFLKIMIGIAWVVSAVSLYREMVRQEIEMSPPKFILCAFLFGFAPVMLVV